MNVPVSKYREGTDHLFTLTRDWHACVGDKERAHWADNVLRMVGHYAEQTCARATPPDITRRAEALRQLSARTEAAPKLPTAPANASPGLRLVWSDGRAVQP